MYFENKKKPLAVFSRERLGVVLYRWRTVRSRSAALLFILSPLQIYKEILKKTDTILLDLC